MQGGSSLYFRQCRQFQLFVRRRLLTWFTSLLVAFLVYVVGSTLYNRYVLHLRGMDQFPSFSFTSMPSYSSPGSSSFAETFRTIVYSIQDKWEDIWSGGHHASSAQWGRWGNSNVGARGGQGWAFRNGGGSGYNRMAEEEEAIADARFSLEDESEDDERPLPSVPTQPQVDEDTKGDGSKGDGVIRLG